MAQNGTDKPIDLMKLSQKEAERLQRAIADADEAQTQKRPRSSGS